MTTAVPVTTPTAGPLGDRRPADVATFLAPDPTQTKVKKTS
ncbi:hypothetical protein PV416_37645 [Streptomyces ipomoeae]|jgi:hypothetical protein|nr:hypothetical protein [Streptomyces ipomoeae]MDX2826647.1 hypothetical protein [Streptomyces ipomoeae]MDX2878992.1 hypothetical protein [Streptomyces ipomoeae]